jgi:hypothetical protein
VEGYLYQHSLTLKTSGDNSKNPGTQFINGTIDIATDDALTNIVTVHFTYVTAKTSKGNDNATFTTLQNVINGTYGNVMEHGIDKAVKFRIDSQVGLNEFYSNRTGKEELVSTKRNEGGFVHVVQNLAADENTRNTFETDMIITGARRVEADEEKKIPEKVIVKGFIFDFRNALLPVEYVATMKGAMDYFENLEASQKNPVYTKVWGRQVSQTVITRTVEESAFGEQKVTEVPRTNREFIITGAMSEPYVWDDESTMTQAEYEQAIADRNLAVAEIKRRQDEYNASKAQTQAPAATVGSIGGFNF